MNEWIIEAVSLAYDFAPPPPPPLVSSTGDTQGGKWERETTCLQESGDGGGGGAKSYDTRKPGPHGGIRGWAYKSCSQEYRTGIIYTHYRKSTKLLLLFFEKIIALKIIQYR
jgi:hypothetical protein